ncbi:hypothetical protein NYR55_02160 [Sphingomonas sp. BGYR3]|uniref:hypothetical protein n=1 Tax=Sphingomonas sp. BGYR3 TaxID=2975483 RepID=UPI0021A798DF|nr:hypothetical protein [Sphingomonas sp. BGYR3]MDG5487430.1 hypothetical protein [Sphingomonas sp. BGYR3]
MPIYLLILAIQIACIVHVIRNGRNQLWLLALFFLPVASAIAYLLVEVLPGARGNRHVRLAESKVRNAIDPERELRSARDALDLADTVANRERLADALMALGRHAEALPVLCQLAAMPGGGIPTQRRKLARALYETNEPAGALTELDAAGDPSTQADRDRVMLLRARILEDLGKREAAAAIYADIVTRLPGEEARCRYAALLIALGWRGEALTVLEEVERRAKRLDRTQRAAEAEMYRWAADTLAELRG